MQPDARESAAEWLAHADNDLLAVARLIGIDPVLSGPAAFHAQQAAEKSLKAFLTAWGQTFTRTHDLYRLLQPCVAIDGTFRELENHAQVLTPYAIEFRYPEGVLNPEPSTALEAQALAAEVVAFVRARLDASSNAQTERE